MDRINDPSAPGRLFVDEDLLAGIQGTIVRALWTNGVQEEMVAGLIEGTGQTPNAADATQISRGVQIIARGRVAEFQTPGSYTFVVPAGVYRIMARVWAGGGGSGGTYQAGSASLGGGGGGYSERRIAVTPGDVITIIVGAGGAAGVGGPGPTAGGAGGSSSVGSYCSASGGQGGAPATGSAAGGGTTGGRGYGGDFNGFGSGCDGPFNLTSSNVYTSRSGAAPLGGLSAHAGTTNISAPGVAGYFPGGGAAGGANESNGAAGGGGRVTLEY